MLLKVFATKIFQFTKFQQVPSFLSLTLSGITSIVTMFSQSSL